ncbi:hypothetical protein [Geminocystis sp.]|uniref:hypothetical protein n=1 Tax=Geminocystis sp. TaxID=2664100 RepID=UPI003594186E
MSTVTDNDLRELKDLINSKFEQVNDKLNDLKVEVAILKEGQNGINKTLDNLNFIARTVIGGVVLALLAGLGKILYPNLLN